MIIAVDFDGTLVENAWPAIGPDVPLAFRTLGDLIGMGHKIILWTVRSGESLDEALLHCALRHVEFWGVNENPDQKDFVTSEKVYCDVLIDDTALGCPLIRPGNGVGKSYVDWAAVRKYFKLRRV